MTTTKDLNPDCADQPFTNVAIFEGNQFVILNTELSDYDPFIELAIQAAKDAEAARDKALEYSKNSQDSANASDVSAKASKASADASEVSNKASQDAANRAKASQDDAANSKTKAAQSAAAAKASQDAAWRSENASKASEVASKASENASASSAAAAKVSESAAKVSETKSKTSETNARASEVQAAKEAITATNQAGNAGAQAQRSKDWATKPENQVVEGTEYSSKHYAAKSAKSAAQAKTSETNARKSADSAAISAAKSDLAFRDKRTWNPKTEKYPTDRADSAMWLVSDTHEFGNILWTSGDHLVYSKQLDSFSKIEGSHVGGGGGGGDPIPEEILGDLVMREGHAIRFKRDLTDTTPLHAISVDSDEDLIVGDVRCTKFAIMVDDPNQIHAVTEVNAQGDATKHYQMLNTFNGVPKIGGTFTGLVKCDKDPAGEKDLSRKKYVDNRDANTLATAKKYTDDEINNMPDHGDVENKLKNYVKKSGDTMTGTLYAPAVDASFIHSNKSGSILAITGKDVGFTGYFNWGAGNNIMSFNKTTNSTNDTTITTIHGHIKATEISTHNDALIRNDQAALKFYQNYIGNYTRNTDWNAHNISGNATVTDSDPASNNYPYDGIKKAYGFGTVMNINSNNTPTGVKAQLFFSHNDTLSNGSGLWFRSGWANATTQRGKWAQVVDTLQSQAIGGEKSFVKDSTSSGSLSGLAPVVIGKSRQQPKTGSKARRLSLYPPYHTGVWNFDIHDSGSSDLVFSYSNGTKLTLTSGGDLSTVGQLKENGQRVFSPFNRNITTSLNNNSATTYLAASAGKRLWDDMFKIDGSATMRGDIQLSDTTRAVRNTNQAGAAIKFSGSAAGQSLLLGSGISKTSGDVRIRPHGVDKADKEFKFDVNGNLVLPPHAGADPSKSDQGSIRFNGGEKKFEGYDGDEWGDIGGGGTPTFNVLNVNKTVDKNTGTLFDVSQKDLNVKLPSKANIKVGQWVSVGVYGEAKGNKINLTCDDISIMGLGKPDQPFIIDGDWNIFTFSYVDAAKGYIAVNAVGESEAPNAIRTTVEKQYKAGTDTFSIEYDVGFVDVVIEGLQMPRTSFNAGDGKTVKLNKPLAKDSYVKLVGWNHVTVDELNADMITTPSGATVQNEINDLKDGLDSNAKAIVQFPDNIKSAVEWSKATANGVLDSVHDFHTRTTGDYDARLITYAPNSTNTAEYKGATVLTNAYGIVSINATGAVANSGVRLAVGSTYVSCEGANALNVKDQYGKGGNQHFWFQDKNGSENALMWYEPTTRSLNLRSHNSNFALSVRSESGQLIWGHPNTGNNCMIATDGNIKGAIWGGDWMSNRVFHCGTYPNVNTRVKGWRGVQSNYLEIMIDGQVCGINYFLSDKRMKKDIDDTEETALDKISQIPFKKFTWNDQAIKEAQGKHEKIGFIAQDVEEIVPEWVNTHDKGNDTETKSVNTNSLLTYALKAIQELQAEVESLKANQ
ncbi:hypothetical protein VCHA31O73_360046 [Vibrio chagasii]|nr:hypothetical protein VCHA31O73_360046 [Vibrio chagasii]